MEVRNATAPRRERMFIGERKKRGIKEMEGGRLLKYSSTTISGRSLILDHLLRCPRSNRLHGLQSVVDLFVQLLRISADTEFC